MKNILITGCSSGFGKLAAEKFSADGHTVFATMRNTTSKNKAAAEELSALPNIHVVEMDVSSEESVNNAAKSILAIATPDVVINNAGQMFVGVTEAFTPEDLTRQLDVNVVGVHRVTRAFLPAMREAGSGLFINVSSVAGRFGLPFFGVYHASKWALEGYTLGLRNELAQCGIDFTVVEPGPFATELFGQSPQPSDQDRINSYPEIIPQTLVGMTKNFEDIFANSEAPTDPAIVVEVFQNLVNMAPGTRPFRTTAGLDFGVADRNKSDMEHDAKLVEAMGMVEFTTLKN